jgi:hypothetical protein
MLDECLEVSKFAIGCFEEEVLGVLSAADLEKHVK